MVTTTVSPFVFYVGGKGAATDRMIYHMIRKECVVFRQHGELATTWRPNAFQETVDVGQIPVLVDFTAKTRVPGEVKFIRRDGDKGSLLQVVELLEVEPERIDYLLDANAIGYVAEMRKHNATDEEIKTVLEADRATRGITPSEEVEAEIAITRAERLGDGLSLARLVHDKCSAVRDRLYDKQEVENLLVIINYGKGASYYGHSYLCHKLIQKFGGWAYFWPQNNHWHGNVPEAEVKQFIEHELES